MIETQTGRMSEGARSMPPRALKPPRPADYKLPVGMNARPTTKGWLLVDYAWDERTGIARLSYRCKWNPAERLVVEVPQPAGAHQEGWSIKPPIDHPAVLARYFESQRKQMEMQALGVYGR